MEKLKPIEKKAKVISEKVHDWLSNQKYGDEALLHAAVCCDFVGMVHFKKAMATVIAEALSDPTRIEVDREKLEEYRYCTNCQIINHKMMYSEMGECPVCRHKTYISALIYLQGSD